MQMLELKLAIASVLLHKLSASSHVIKIQFVFLAVVVMQLNVKIPRAPVMVNVMTDVHAIMKQVIALIRDLRTLNGLYGTGCTSGLKIHVQILKV